jgi:hypothetical protein
MRKILLVVMVLWTAIAFAQGGTYSSDILPSTTGLNLGNPNQQWNLFMQDGRFYRNTYLSNPSGTRTFNILPSFSTSLVTCTQNDGTRCYFDSGSATTNGLRDCGLWNPTTTYVVQCVVQYIGSSWVSVAPTTGVAPGTDNGVDWHLFANAGINGVDGANGSDGAPGTPGYSPNQLLSGGAVVWTSNYNYTVSAASYLINNVVYNSPQTNITLAPSDPTDPRCDLVYFTSTGVAVATGVAAAQPACPVLDPSTQLQDTPLRVDANTTQPATIYQTDIYHENVEWTMTRSGTTINLASTNNPHSGTVDIEGTNTVTNNSFTATIPSGSIDLALYNNFVFYIRPKAAWASNRTMTIQWLSGTTVKGASVAFGNGSFGFNSANLTYQQIVIPTSVFGINGTSLTAIRFTMSGASTVAFGWYVDDIILQSGTAPTAGQNAMVWRDPWNIVRTYAVNDTVSYQNNGYVAMVINTGQTPSQASTTWHPITNVGPPWISTTANPASAGIIRLANNTDKECWRNAGNSGDLCFWLDSGNIWNLDGTGGTELGITEETTSAASNGPSAGIVTQFVDSVTHLVCTKTSTGTVTCPGTGGGSVTGVTATTPIASSGGTAPDISCPTCVTAAAALTANQIVLGAGLQATAKLGSLGTTTTVLHGNAAGAPTFGAVVGSDMTNNTVTSTQMAVVNTRRVCMLQVGDGTNTVASGDYSPFKVSSCTVPYAATIVEINLQSDAGTPSVVLERRRGAATLADLLSGALAAAGTTHTCALTGTSGTCIDGTTSSGTITLSNTGLNAGDVIEVKSGTASTETSMRIAVVFTVN